MNTRTLSRLTVTAALGLLAACGGEPEGEGEAATAAADAAPAIDGDRIPTEEGGDLVVLPVRHGTLVLAWNGNTIYVDPAPRPGGGGDASAAADFEGVPEPTLILLTDVHSDHLSPATLNDVTGPNTTIIAPNEVVDQLPAPVKPRARPLANGESATVGEVQVEAVPMYNLTQDRLQYHEKGRGNGYVLTVGGTRVYIAGDTEDIPEMRALRDIDVAFVPMNLPYTMTPEQAASAVLAFRPKIVYPYHFGQSDVNQFASLVGDTAGVEVRVRPWYP